MQSRMRVTSREHTQKHKKETALALSLAVQQFGTSALHESLFNRLLLKRLLEQATWNTNHLTQEDGGQKGTHLLARVML